MISWGERNSFASLHPHCSSCWKWSLVHKPRGLETIYGKQNSSLFVQTKHIYLQDVFFAKSPRELQWLVLSTWENLQSRARWASGHACAIVLLMLADVGKSTLIKGRIIPWEEDHEWIKCREGMKHCHAFIPLCFLIMDVRCPAASLTSHTTMCVLNWKLNLFSLMLLTSEQQ